MSLLLIQKQKDIPNLGIPITVSLDGGQKYNISSVRIERLSHLMDGGAYSIQIGETSFLKKLMLLFHKVQLLTISMERRRRSLGFEGDYLKYIDNFNETKNS